MDDACCPDLTGARVGSAFCASMRGEPSAGPRSDREAAPSWLPLFPLVLPWPEPRPPFAPAPPPCWLLLEVVLVGWFWAESCRLLFMPVPARSRRNSGMMTRRASRPRSFGANSSIRIPWLPTCARTVTGPRLSGVTLRVTTCSPDAALVSATIGCESCVASGGAGGAGGAAGAGACAAATDGVPTGAIDTGIACGVVVVATGAAGGAAFACAASLEATGVDGAGTGACGVAAEGAASPGSAAGRAARGGTAATASAGFCVGAADGAAADGAGPVGAAAAGALSAVVAGTLVGAAAAGAVDAAVGVPGCAVVTVGLGAPAEFEV